MGRKRKLSNKDAILKASYNLFMARGYENVSALDIEHVCNVQTRSFYRYFKNKDEILGTIIVSIEKKMLDYLQPVLTALPILTFTLFSLMKVEYAIQNPDYFRMRASFISRADTFIKGFMELLELSFPQGPDWMCGEPAILQGLYVLGGMLLVQYGFVKNISGSAFSEESDDFMTNYGVHTMSAQTADSYRMYMNYALRNDLHILGVADSEIDGLLEDAYKRLGKIDIPGFRAFIGNELGFV